MLQHIEQLDDRSQSCGVEDHSLAPEQPLRAGEGLRSVCRAVLPPDSCQAFVLHLKQKGLRRLRMDDAADHTQLGPRKSALLDIASLRPETVPRFLLAQHGDESLR